MKRLLVAAAFLAAVMAAGPAQAGYELDFGMVFPTPGTISYAGGASALVGSNIQVDNVVGGMDVPAHSNIMLNLAGGVLDFTTGSLSSYSNGTWDFNGGGTITLMGGIDLNGDGILEIPLGTTLLSGTFDSASVTSQGTSFKIAAASFGDTKNPDLLAYYGLGAYATQLLSGNFNISFRATPNTDHSFVSSELLSGDLVNEVPEPGSMLLLGSGLFGLAGMVRRRFAKK